jgi:outer membrane translocation and assembly module TamA
MQEQKQLYKVKVLCLLGRGGKKYKAGDLIHAGHLVGGETEAKERLQKKYIEVYEPLAMPADDDIETSRVKVIDDSLPAVEPAAITVVDDTIPAVTDPELNANNGDQEPANEGSENQSETAQKTAENAATSAVEATKKEDKKAANNKPKDKKK